MGRTKEAISKQREAARLRSDGRIHNAITAQRLEAEAAELLVPEACDVILGEAVPTSVEKFGIRDTLEHPDTVAIEASESRLDLLTDSNSLELALDCCDSVGAKNSVERMLCHQASLLHKVAMQFLSRAADSAMVPVEAARLANSARGLVQSFSAALLTLQQLRTGGSQQIIVQRVELRDQSRAVIATGGGHAPENKQ